MVTDWFEGIKPSAMIFPRAWQMMAKEGHLMRASFLNGFDLFYKSSFDFPGIFYSAFFQLSSGLERLMKIVVILDHKTKNDLVNPTDKQYLLNPAE